jgi:23S rRNA (cytosine1962-C5)-methyltransferase
MAGPYPDALVVKPAGEKAIRQRHHWIFSGAIASLPRAENGSLVAVRGEGGQHLGYAYFNSACSLAARVVSFDATPPLEALRARLEEAAAMRAALLGDLTDAYRVVNGEADGMPGLVLDRYGDAFVMQLGTLGLDRIRGELVRLIVEVCGPAGLFERSDSASRTEEGLAPSAGWLAGTAVPHRDVREGDLVFRVPIEGSQKTGFFLDQRSMRGYLRELAAGRQVLDCFCYTGGFGIAALKGGARHVDFVDASHPAIEAAAANLALNGLAAASGSFHAADAFEFLRAAPRGRYDAIVLDPPAFAKHRKDVVRACRAYKDANRVALQKIAPGGLLFTFSCSSHVDAALFQKVVFQAAAEAGRPARIVQRHRQAVDHPVNLYHPETEYLKGLVLYVS